MNRSKSCFWILVITILAIGIAVSLKPEDATAIVSRGDRAPSFSLETVDGKKFTFSPGKAPSLIFFFSAFCPDCREITPSIIQIVDSLGSRVNLVSVNVDGKRFSNAVENFVSEFRLPYPVVYDRINNDLFVAADPYGIRNTPTLIAVDSYGKVCAKLEVSEIYKKITEIKRCFQTHANK